MTIANGQRVRFIGNPDDLRNPHGDVRTGTCEGPARTAGYVWVLFDPAGNRYDGDAEMCKPNELEILEDT
jgi:hypothetical protein